ncbi:MAG: ABC transporter permease [Candidatus Heimdallarchaeota archaeon]|nr:ABC transporter permease [Candidatus Heimdallarchaeota archaeon]
MVAVIKELTGELPSDNKITTQYGKSRSVSTLSVIKTTLVRDFRILKRYKANLIGGFVQILVFMLIFGLFAFAASFRDLTLSNKDMFIFFLGGLTLIFFSDTALFSPVRAVNRELYNGTLEYVYGTPSSRYGYFVGAIIANMVISMIFFVPIFGFMLWYAEPSLLNAMAIFGAILAVLVVFTSFGIMIAMMGIMWKNTTSIVGILGLLFQFMTGMFFPVTSLPVFAQWIGFLLPMTWGLDLVRYYSFNGNWDTLQPVWMEWSFLLIFMVIYTLLAKRLMVRTEKHAKNKGLHLI